MFCALVGQDIRTISPLVFLFVYFFQFKTDKYADLFCILCHISIVSVAKKIKLNHLWIFCVY